MELAKGALIIDRIEADFAICESEDELLKIELGIIKGEPKEGDVLRKKNSFYYVDIELTNKRKIVVEDLMKGMWE